ncbi:MAG: terminase small subunit [Pseudomonadota bacterium]
MPAGRPPLWSKQADLQAQVDAYFVKCVQEESPPGIYGLADFLSCDPTTFYDYERGEQDTDTEQFSHTLKKARSKIVAYAESRIYEKTAGAVFQLVNLTRKFPEPSKNAQHQEITGDKGGPLAITITSNQAGIV